MIKRNNKKGFTIVELVIVIAVIAILAAVLIPTFAGIIKKANLSADMQAVRQMNTALAVDGAVTPTDIFELHEVLDELGLTSEDYKPLTKDTYFFWDADKNRVLHVDENNVVIAPEEYAGEKYEEGKSKWFSLSLAINTAKPEGFSDKASTVTVKSGAEMMYVIDAITDKKTNNALTITIDGTIDMMGAAFAMPEIAVGETIKLEGTNNATIKNATAIDFAQGATADEEGKDGLYGCGLFPIVKGSVSISNIAIENMNVKNTNVSGAGLLIGQLYGSAEISNVTINDSTVIGHRSIGALVGTTTYNSNLKIGTGISLNNVSVQTVGGRSGMLVGLNGGAKIEFLGNNNEITLTNCSYGIYDCAQTKGTVNGTQLGLDNNIMTSHLTNTNEIDQQWYVANALVLKPSYDANNAQIKVQGSVKEITTYEAADTFNGHVTGWN